MIWLRIVVLSLFAAASLRADPGPLVLWYTNAAVTWQQEALPVGNGKLAAMVYGGVTNEQIQLTEETIWTGQPHDYSHPGAWTLLPQLQNYIFQTNQTAFWSQASTGFMSIPLRQCAYQPAGVLALTFPHGGSSNYLRSLNLETATASVRYDHAGTTYQRDVFASAPDKVIVMRLTASQPGKLSFTCTFNSVHVDKTISTSGTDLILHASVATAANGMASSIQFESRLRIIPDGGSISASSNSVTVANANSVTLLLSVASNFVNYDDVSGNPALLASNHIAAASAKAYAALRQAQLNDYQPLFQRVVLDLGSTSKTNFPTGYRIKRAWEGNDPQLSTLYFQMGRYLMISGSRPGTQPLYLQGKWNDTTTPSWESKMTLNINEEMNYWGAEVCNLSECHQPLFDLIADLSVTGSKVAQSNYNADGWVVHHNTDLWRGAAPINGKDGVWPTGGAWLCQHLWWHYQFSGDTNFLANTAYPLMKGAAQFFKDFLIPHPSNTNWLVTNPSFSPEHDHPTFGPNVAGPTMDNDLIRDLLNNLIQAGEILGIDAAFRTNMMILRDRLPPDQIGEDGQLQEWLEDVDKVNDTHRHCSHLVGLFPGEHITPFYNPILCAAAKVSTDWRGIGDIGWGKAWRMCLQSRLLNSGFVYQIHTNMLSRDVSTNMMFTDVNNRQVDGIFGAMAGVAETLLQSQSGEVFLLPSVPSKWTNGFVSGLCARGGFELSIQWQSNSLASATILSKLGNVCRIRSKWPVTVMLGSNCIDAPMVQPGVWQFPTTAGSNYTIVRAAITETEACTVSTSPGDSHQTFTNSAFSNLLGTRLNANAPGDFVTYVVSNVVAGLYRVQVVADAGVDCGRFQLAAGPTGGALTNIGPVQDTWSSTNMVVLLPTNALTTTLLWTNMLKEFDCGTWQANSNGIYQFRLQVVDKNVASSGYALALDYLKFTPVSETPSSPIEQWRVSKFGVATNNPSISGDGADPDLDGIANLFEYASGREPMIPDQAPLFTASEQSGYLTVTYQRAKAATDVAIAVEVSNAITGPWTTDVQTPIVTDDGNGLTETVVVRDSVPIGSMSGRFMRMRVNRL